MQELKDALKLMEALKEKRDGNQFSHITHYEKQWEYLCDSGKIAVLLGGNQCLAGSEEIWDPVAKIYRRIDQIEEAFHVESWDGEKVVIARALPPYRVDQADIQRVYLSNGEHFDCSDHHSIMRENDSWFFPEVGQVYASPEGSPVEVTKIEIIGHDWVWDFEVPTYRCYIHKGLIHHNCGKTRTGSYEVTCHLTGNYPKDWKGVRFNRPVKIWVVGESSVRVRDTIQEKLFGDLGNWGTGMIPKDCIQTDTTKSGFDFLMKAGVPQAIDIARVKHKSGGFSTLQFFSYDQGRDKFQGSSVDFIWFDEEPPEDIYNECKMRVIAKSGYIRFTFTPLGGVTALYDGLMQNENIRKHHLTMNEAKHLTKESKDLLLEGLSESERQAREMGVATIGSGKVFQFEESEYVCEDFEIPRHWRRIGGLDVGLDHPTCAVAMAIDDEANCVYIYKEYKKAGATPLMHTTHLRNWGLEFSTDPHAFDRAIGTGVSAATIYEDDGHGLKLFKAPAGPGSVDASINKIRAWIGSGRFWIFKTCKELVEEFRLYRTDKNGKIYKVNDDTLDAARYAFMSIDKATIDGRRKQNVDFTVEEWKPSSKYGY